MNFAKNIATRFVFMENGEITEDGSYQEVFEEKKHEKIRSFLQI
jgi:polar amino acid transport system ATP-binding protein